MMSQYVVVYTGGAMGETPEAQEASLNAWMAWFGSLGDKVTQMGSPFGESVAVSADASMSAATTGLSGFSILEAPSLAETSKLVTTCPIYSEGGGVELYQALMM
jgi:hypothetical protein